MKKQLRKVKKAADAARPIFIEYKGVLGVGYGYKCTGGRVTDKLAIVVWVEKKLLNEDILSGQHIPPHYAEYPTDVETVQLTSKTGEEDTAGLHEGRPIYEFLDWGKIHRLNVAQKGGHLRPPGNIISRPNGRTKPEFKSPDTEVRGDLFVIEDDGSLVFQTAEQDVRIPDFVGAWNLFRDQFGDDYDFVALYFDDTDEEMPEFKSTHLPIYRDSAETGYGEGPIDHRTYYGLGSRLLSLVAYSHYKCRELIHEIGHRWLFYVDCKTPDGVEHEDLHNGWLYEDGWDVHQKDYHPGTWPDSDRSPMFYGYYDWVQDTANPGIFYRVPNHVGDPDDAVTYKFSPLDQYLMGFLHKQAVSSSPVVPPYHPVTGGDFQIISNVAVTDGNFDSFYPGETPWVPDPLLTISVDDIIRLEGERRPNHLDSQRVFHMAVMAITYDRVASAAFLDSAEEHRKTHAEFWRKATEGRSVIDASLLRPNVDDIFIRDNTDDQGDESSSLSGAFWDSPDICVRNCEDDPEDFEDPDRPNAEIHQAPRYPEGGRRNQGNWVYARVSNRSETDYLNVQVNFYLANFNGFSGRDTVDEAIPRTEVIYPVDWHPESRIGFDVLERVRAGETAVARAFWSTEDPPLESEQFHPCLLVEIIPLGPEPRGLHYVWENKKLAQKNITIDYVQGPICPNPTPPAPYRHYLPFTFGHTLTTSKTASVELERNVDDPHLTVYLDPGDALRTLYRIGNRLYHLVPPEREDDAGSPASKLQELVPRPVTGSAVVDIPAGTELVSVQSPRPIRP